MCEYCEGKTPLDEYPEGWDNGVDMWIEYHEDDWFSKLHGDGYFVVANGYYDGGYGCGSATFKCDFCPACGKDLRSKNEVC